MSRLTKRWPLLLLGVTLLTMVLLAAGLNKSTLGPSEPFPVWLLTDLVPDEVTDERGPSGYRPANGATDLRQACFLLLILLVFGAWLITFIIRPQARNRMITRLLGYILILLLIGWAYGEITVPQPEDSGGDEGEIGYDGSFLQDAPPLPNAVTQPPEWLVILITLAVISAVLAMGWWLWERRRRRLQADPAQRLAQEAGQAAKTLEAGSDLKDTVLRCYRDMSRVLSDSRNIHREKAMTPREFEQHLAGIGLSDDYIRRLTRLFESVRYGSHTAGERDKREAVDCLNAIARAYGGSTAGSTPPARENLV